LKNHQWFATLIIPKIRPITLISLLFNSVLFSLKVNFIVTFPDI